MAEVAKGATMLGDVAAILSALAWPGVLAYFLLRYRNEVGRLFAALITKVEKAKTIKAGGIEIAEEEITQALAAATVAVAPLTTQIPETQVADAKTLAENLSQAGVTRVEASVSARARWLKLAQEYEEVRRTQGSGPERTQQMGRIMAQMRTLGLLVRASLPYLTESKSAGERLVAIASLQVQSDPAYTSWLADRMGVESPFVFFNAALALRHMVVEREFASAGEMKALLTSAIETVKSYKEGPPDEDTLFVLRDAVNRLGWQ